MERRRNGETDRRRTWLAAASGEPTCRYGMDVEITSSRLSDLLSLLLVPASSAWQDPACPDHSYALQPSSELPFTFYTSLWSSKLISFSETLPFVLFYTCFKLFCWTKLPTSGQKSFSSNIYLFSLICISAVWITIKCVLLFLYTNIVNITQHALAKLDFITFMPTEKNTYIWMDFLIKAFALTQPVDFFPCSNKNCKSFIKVDVLQWTETDGACGSMFLLEITLFVCSVESKKKKKKVLCIHRRW